MIRTLSLLAAALAAAAAAQTPLKKTLVASGLQRPVWIGAPVGDDRRLFVAEEHEGRVRVVDFDRGLLAQPFLPARARFE